MGVVCEIEVFDRAKGGFVPGDEISGEVKYGINRKTSFDKITISLKGVGVLELKDAYRNIEESSYTKKKYYVNEKLIVKHSGENSRTSMNWYVTQFKFHLPYNLPPMFVFSRDEFKCNVSNRISYYIQAKFHNIGIYRSNKIFKKSITVRNDLSRRRYRVEEEVLKDFDNKFNCKQMNKEYANDKKAATNNVLKSKESNSTRNFLEISQIWKSHVPGTHNDTGADIEEPPPSYWEAIGQSKTKDEN